MLFHTNNPTSRMQKKPKKVFSLKVYWCRGDSPIYKNSALINKQTKKKNMDTHKNK